MLKKILIFSPIVSFGFISAYGGINQIRFKNIAPKDGVDITAIIGAPPMPITGNYENLSNVFSMEEYFENLDVYFAKNHFGSCAFTAITMLLSYYDTFYNDSLVHEGFEGPSIEIDDLGDDSYYVETSPGVSYSNSKLGCTESTKELYYQNTSSYLMDSHFISLNNYDDSVNVTKYQTLLNSYYGANYVKIISNLKSAKDCSTTTYVDVVKSLINSGKPVILNICDGSNYTKGTKFHAVVAYAYDEENIYCHFGWNAYTTKVPTTYNGYTRIYGFAYIDFYLIQFAHSHSHRYM